MAVAADAFFVAYGLSHGLAQRNTDVFDRVVAVDMQIALAVHVQVNQAVAGNLVEHVVQKADAALELGGARAVQIDGYGNICFGRLAADLGRAWGR